MPFFLYLYQYYNLSIKDTFKLPEVQPNKKTKFGGFQLANYKFDYQNLFKFLILPFFPIYVMEQEKRHSQRIPGFFLYQFCKEIPVSVGIGIHSSYSIFQKAPFQEITSSDPTAFFSESIKCTKINDN